MCVGFAEANADAHEWSGEIKKWGDVAKHVSLFHIIILSVLIVNGEGYLKGGGGGGLTAVLGKILEGSGG